MDAPLPFTPLVIIGAPRSGTNILRDVVCRLPGFATWDCDEINPVWRHGHIGRGDDRFTAAMVTSRLRRFVRARFAGMWRRLGEPRYLVEKTCANSLRVSYVAEILPEARFVFITRDGVDVVASARKRWQGELEVEALPYYWAKLRHTPLADIPVYAWRFVAARARRVAGQRHLSFWGPQYPGLAGDLDTRTLEEVCARQWAFCVREAERDLAALPGDAVFRIIYEDFVADPAATLSALTGWLGEDIPADAIARACAPVSGRSVGKGRTTGDGDALRDTVRKAVADLITADTPPGSPLRAAG